MEGKKQKQFKKLSFSFLPIPEEVMVSESISWGAKFLFGIIAKANQEKIFWSNKYLAKRMKCTEREVRNRTLELIGCNLIIVIPRPGKTNEYQVNLELIQMVQMKMEEDTPEQTFRGQIRSGGDEQGVQGGDERPVQDIKELSLKTLIKEDDFKNLKRLGTLKAGFIKKTQMVSPAVRTKIQEEVAPELRARNQSDV